MIIAGLMSGLFGGLGVAHADVVVGLALTETGRFADRSRRLRAEAEDAVGLLNASGGLLGERIRLMVADDSCTEAGARAVAEAFVHADARLVLGHLCDRAAITAAGVYGPAGLLFLATETRHPALTERRAGKTIYRLAGRDDRQGEAAGRWLAQAARAGAVAIVRDQSGSAHVIAEQARDTVAGKGLPAPPILVIETGKSSYAALVSKLRDRDIAAIFFAGYPAEAAILLDELRSSGMRVAVLGSDTLAGAAFAKAAFQREPKFRVLVQPALAAVGSKAGTDKDDADRERTTARGRAAGALQIWADAVRRTGSTDGALVGVQLDERTFFALPFGSVSFNAKGDAGFPSFVPAVFNGTRWVRED